ncbi:hypothetical protein PAECIP111893_02224 [Paenibacillus plantiphilus]|uniref:Lipoprotein n=1 Tax=Paenibacillus plantiphilus TaxID=2905650 RepID=A0ABM9C7X3_9BACL|nr:hypothetical protein [Paenibacillus plantiphilus]CAH1204327.1 hypothetical protein PAECIP111893_02224 [Paenibacillus plantiphilus]
MGRNIAFFFVLSLILMSSCSDSNYITNNSKPVSQQSPQEISNHSQLIHYSEYQQIFETFTKELSISGYSYKSGSVGPNIVIMDKDLSFNKREYLTLDGKFDMNNTQPTSELLLFENEDSSKQLAIRISYTTSYIGNDLVDWSSSRGYSGTNEALAKKTDLVTLSYKNLILTILQTSEEEADMEASKTAVRSIISIISKY